MPEDDFQENTQPARTSINFGKGVELIEGETITLTAKGKTISKTVPAGKIWQLYINISGEVVDA